MEDYQAARQIRGQTHLKSPQFKILLAFWLDIELLWIKIATPQFSLFQIGELIFLAVVSTVPVPPVSGLISAQNYPWLSG